MMRILIGQKLIELFETEHKAFIDKEFYHVEYHYPAADSRENLYIHFHHCETQKMQLWVSAYEDVVLLGCTREYWWDYLCKLTMEKKPFIQLESII